MNRKDQRQLETARRGQVDAAEHLAKSQEAIKESLALLQRSDGMEVGQKRDRRRRIPNDPARSARESPSR